MKFGTSGIRGLATELVGAASGLYAEAFARHLLANDIKPGSSVYIGRDLRDSSPAIAESCMAALAAIGLRPVDCGVIPTPALALYAWMHQAPALMVTGSHIPADRNGIKFYTPHGEITKIDEAAITRIVGELSGTCSSSPLLGTPLPVEHDEAMAAYIARANDILEPGSLSGLRLGVYQHSSAARDLLAQLLASFGAEVVPLGRAKVFVPVDTEAVDAETLEKMRNWAREFGLDAIVSADADADRPLVVDENGDLFRGDLIGLATSLFLKADTVVTPVTSNSGISPAFGFDVVRTRVGSPFVIEAMETSAQLGKIVVGFEANGGFLLGSNWSRNGKTLVALPTRDSLLPILAVLSTAASAKKSLSALRSTWKLPVCASERIENFPTENSRELIRHLGGSRDALQAFLSPYGTVAGVDETDGLRTTMNTGEIIHLRPSGNAPELRCYSEAATYDRATAIVAETLKMAQAFASTNERGLGL